MTTRALTLALRLLTTACAGAALGSMTGCPFLLFDCPEPWSEVESVELGTEAEILAIVRGGDFDELVAVGVGGVVVHGAMEAEPSVSNPTNQTLRDAVAVDSMTVVVGDGGTILVSTDGGASWTAETAPTSADLLGVAYLQTADTFVAIGADQLLVRGDDGTWTAAQPPAEGWGGLASVFVTPDEFWVVGAGGSAWVSSDPWTTWLREETGASVDFIAGGRVSGTENDGYRSGLVLASTSALWFRASDETTWTELSASLDGAIVAFGGGYLVTTNGVVYDVDEIGGVSSVANIGLAPRTISGAWSGFVVAGEGGNAARAYEQFCVGGRPWIVDGQLTTAAVDGEIPVGEGTRLEGVLVSAWVQDALYEHASVASFARTVRELMALGAPQALIRATLHAQRDEIEHARMCFALAAPGAGDPLRAGSLPLGHNFGSVSHSRADQPAAIALAMFDEGCINESLAAAEAAVAAASCTEPRARQTLERIAADEARHAALAWRSLRWLLVTYRDEVEPVLRRRLARLRPPSPTPLPVIDDDAAAFAAHGRLSSRERAAIIRRVFAEMIRPLATQMLERIDARSLA